MCYLICGTVSSLNLPLHWSAVYYQVMCVKLSDILDVAWNPYSLLIVMLKLNKLN